MERPIISGLAKLQVIDIAKFRGRNSVSAARRRRAFVIGGVVGHAVPGDAVCFPCLTACHVDSFTAEWILS